MQRVARIVIIVVIVTGLCHEVSFALAKCLPARVLTGQPLTELGSSVAAAGDVDRDGYADVLVGAPGRGQDGMRAGKAYLYSGRTGEILHTFTGEAVCDGFGAAVAGLGAVDAHDHAVMAVGGFVQGATGTGKVFLYSGVTGSLLRTLSIETGVSFLGLSLANAGDVDRDGADDVIVGATMETTEGRAYVFSSRNGEILRVLAGGASEESFGAAVAGAGDVNDDGFVDLIVGAPKSDEAGVDAGKVYVFSGEPTGEPIPILRSYTGTTEGERFGSSVSGAGDVDGDGRADVIVASAGDPEREDVRVPPQAYVFSASDSEPLFTLEQRPTDALVFGPCTPAAPPVTVSGLGDMNSDGHDDLLVGAYLDDTGGAGLGAARVYSGIDGSLLYTFLGEDGRARFGVSVAGAGDVNGDGFPDMIVGASCQPVGDPRNGRAYVYLLGDTDGDGVYDACETCEDIKPLPPGFAVTETLTPSARSCLYQFHAPVGGVVLLSLTDSPDAPDPGDANVLSIRWGQPPTASLSDQIAAERGQPWQRLVIPSARGLTCFARVEATVLNGGENKVRLLYELVDLALEDLSIRYAGQGTGRLSAAIRGGGFDAGTVFRLEREEHRIETAEAPLIVSSERAEVVFDVAAGTPLGRYDLTAEKPDSLGGSPFSARLVEVFEVVPAVLGPRLQVLFLGPARYRHDRLASFNLRLRNVGDAEMTSPLFQITALRSDDSSPLESTEFSLSDQEVPQGQELLVLGVDPDGVAGKLPPGAEVEIPILFRSQGCLDCDAVLEARLFTPNREDFVGWDELVAPEGMTGEEWEGVWPVLSVNLEATTWLQYREALGRLATRLSRRGVNGASVRELFRFAVREAYGRPSSAVVGTARETGTGIPLEGTELVALDGKAVMASTVTDLQGAFDLDWLAAGVEYEIVLVDYDTNRVDVTVPAIGDVYGLELSGETRGSELVPACPNRDESGLPERPLSPPGRLFTTVSSWGFTVISSVDPNKKEGPVGQGEDGSVGLDEELFYQVHFSNEGTAPAQKVKVIDELDSDLDASTLRIRDAKFGRHLVVLGNSSYEAYGAFAHLKIDVTPADDPKGLPVPLEVELEASFDSDGTLEWVFDSPSDNWEVGFLAAKDPASEEDEGYVTFSVEPKPDLAHGTLIENDAELRFDEGEVVPTNTVTNPIHRELLPGTPRHPVPADGTDHVDPDTVLSWEPVPRMENCDVYLWREPEEEPGTPAGADLSTNSFAPPGGLLWGTVYLWRVMAKNSAGVTPGSVWTFATLEEPSGCPSQATSPEPAHGELGVYVSSLTLTWSPDPTALAYSVRVWSALGEKPPLEAGGIVGTTYTPPPAWLEPESLYHWQITCLSAGCEVPGPVWSFRTGVDRFWRGDANADGAVDISDAVYTLLHLFLGRDAPPCKKSADANDDGTLDVSDSTYLLGHLFLGGPPPPEPFLTCGADPTPDDLTCEAFPAMCET